MDSTEEPIQAEQGPSLSDLASAAQSSYNETVPQNYTRLTNLSSPEISTFRHNEKKHVIVAHRGTDLENPKSARKDVRADLNIALGNKEADKLHKKRAKQTEEIVKKLKKEQPDSDIYLTGHSLGGSTSAHALASSDVVRKNVKELHTFNAGASALQSKPDVSPETKAELISKSTHHRVKGDEISLHVASNLIGKQKVYQSAKKPTVAQHILKMATPLLKRTFVGRLLGFGAKKTLNTLQSHSLDNFIKK